MLIIFKEFLKRNWLVIASVLILAINAGVITYKYRSLVKENTVLTEQTIQLRERIKDLSSSVDGLKIYITKQNDSITELADRSALAQQNMKKYMAESVKYRTMYDRERINIESETIGETCQDTIDWMIEKAGDIK